MAFPISPSIDDTHEVGGVTYIWSGKAWKKYQTTTTTTPQASSGDVGKSIAMAIVFG